MDLLHPYNELDVLNRYGKIAPYLQDFLSKKEIASKIVGENFLLLKRGTKNPPLYIKDFKAVDDKFLQLRTDHHLEDVKKQLNKKQILLRQYFVPRKLINFFYACNNEQGKTMDRIFIDIDRQDNSPEDAQKTAESLVKAIQSDKPFSKLMKHKILVMRTGNSFHIILMLAKSIHHKIYDTYLSYGPKKENSFITKRATQVSKDTKLNVLSWHERRKWAIILDSSNTPPGKLARCPFSLHIQDYQTIDGITVPLTAKELSEKSLIPRLQSLTPEKIWENIKIYDKIIKKALR